MTDTELRDMADRLLGTETEPNVGKKEAQLRAGLERVGIFQCDRCKVWKGIVELAGGDEHLCEACCDF